MATEAQQRNYCIFIIKGHKAQHSFLAPNVSPALLAKYEAVQDELLEELRISNLTHSQCHCGKTPCKGTTNGTT